MFLVWAQTDPRLRGDHYNITDFSGGYITDYDKLDIDPKFQRFLMNVEIDHGEMRLREGYKQKFNFISALDGAPAMWDSTFSYLGRITDVYSYNVGGPHLESLDDLAGNVGEVFIAAGIDTVETSLAYIWHMYPSYTPNGTLGKGNWAASWSKDYEMPNSTDDVSANYMNAPGRADRVAWSDPLDFNVSGDVLRAAAGARNSADTLWTYPLWFGPITRYRWNGTNQLDNFYLYKATLENDILDTNTVIADSMKAVPITTPPGSLPDGDDPEDGRIWIKLAVEYDGYQYSLPVGDSTWYVDFAYPDEDMAQISVRLDSLILNARYTAILVFTTDILGELDTYYEDPTIVQIFEPSAVTMSPGVWSVQRGEEVGEVNLDGVEWGGPLYYFRKRVVIADIDSTEIGYHWKDNALGGGGGMVTWEQFAATDSMQIEIWLDADDFDPTQIEMWQFLGHNSTEISAMPTQMATIMGQTVSGDVLIDGPNSKIKKRYRNMLIFSPPGKPDVFAVNNFVMVGHRGTQVTGIEEWDGNAVILTSDGLEVWAPGAPPQRIAYYSGKGCKSPLSVATTPYGIFYANHNGIFVYDGQAPRQINRLIQTSFDSCNVVNATSGLYTVEYGVGVYIPEDDQYAFFCDTEGTAEMDTAYISDYFDSNPLDGQQGVCGNGIVPGWGPWFWGGGNTIRFIDGMKYGGNGGVYVYNILLDSWMKWSTADGFGRFIRGTNDAIYGLVGGDTTSHYLMEMKTNPSAGSYLDDDQYYYSGWQSGWTDFGLSGIEKEKIEGVMVDYYSDAPITTSDAFTVYTYSEGYSTPYDTLTFDYTDSLRYIEYQTQRYQPLRSNIGNQNPVMFDFKGVLADSFKTVINGIKIVYKPRKLRER